MNKINNKFIILIIAIVLISLIPYFFVNLNSEDKVVKSNVKREKVNLTRENFIGYYNKNSMINELPNKAKIVLYLDDERYIVKKGSIKKSQENVDADVIVKTSFVYLKEGSLCSALKKARKNSDLALELKKSKTSLLWKYKGMMKYKDCL